MFKPTKEEIKEVIKSLRLYQSWRRGEIDDTKMGEWGLQSFEIGVMLDETIEILEGMNDEKRV